MELITTFDTGITVLDQFSHNSLPGSVIWDYVIYETTNVRAGSVRTAWNSTNSIEYTERSVADIGSTTDVILSVEISGDYVQLIATSTSDGWTSKTIRRDIARNWPSGELGYRPDEIEDAILLFLQTFGDLGAIQTWTRLQSLEIGEVAKLINTLPAIGVLVENIEFTYPSNVTTDDDGIAKLWIIARATNGASGAWKYAWECRSTLLGSGLDLIGIKDCVPNEGELIYLNTTTAIVELTISLGWRENV